MQVNTKTIQITNSSSKKLKKKERTAGGLRADSETRLFLVGRILCIFVAVLEAVKGSFDGKCYHVEIEDSVAAQTFDLSKCPSGQNSFTFISYLRRRSSDTAYPQTDGEIRTYFRYSNKIEIKIKGATSGNLEELQVFKTDEPTNPIIKARFSMERRSRVIFLQVTSTKATLAVRSFYNSFFDNQNNHEYTFSKANI